MRPEHWLFTVPLRLRSLFRWAQADQELDDELRDHVARKTEEYVAQGITQEEAQRRARLDLGGIEQTKEKCRDARRVNWIQDFVQDLRYGTRTLRKSPGFTAVAVLTLALGIGATTAIFSVVDAVLLRALPYRDPQRLVSFFEDLSKVGYPRIRVSPPTYLDLKAQTRVFEDVAAVNETGFNFSRGTSGATQLSGALVTYNLFAVLGAEPLIGATFLPEEDRPGANHVVLLSYSFWQSEFAGSERIIGQTIRLNDEPYTVKGIMRPSFSFPDKEIGPIQVWVPRAFTSQELAARTARYLIAVGRLRRGISLDEANADLHVLASQDTRQYPNDMLGVSRFFAEPLQESNTHDSKRGLVMLMTAVGFILLIACANVANLLLSRAAARKREIVLRAAFGASTGRIIRQLLAESALLSVIGGVLGTGLAISSFTLLKHLIPEDLSHTTSLTFNLPVFGFSVLVSLACSFMFGLAPARQIAKVDLNEALREGGRGSAGSRQKLSDVFVAAEMAFSLVLLVCAGLLLRSFWNLRRVDPGFQPTHVLTLDFDLAEPKYRDWLQRKQFLERFLEGTRTLPVVQSAGLTGGMPLTSKGGLREEVTPEGSSTWSEIPATVVFRVITPGFLETLKIPLIRGRSFDSRDGEQQPQVVIINQKAAQDFWPNQDPIGKRLKFGRADGDSPWLQVVGVTRDIKEAGLNEPTRYEVYCPYLQSGDSWEWPRFVVVRTTGEPLQVQEELRRLVVSIDPQEPLNHVMTMSEIVDRETSQTATQAALLSGLAALALILAGVGIYGVMAYLVSQRTNEMGIRMALGAHRRNILRLVLGHGTRLVLAGVGIGLVAAFMLTRLMRSLLFGVSPFEPMTFVGVTILLTVVALAACYIPALRATRVDPMVALRYE
jgi:putative ABC transport system permease protein